MPGWHAKTKADVEAGNLQVLGIVQEQHPDRAALFMQWKEMKWPVLADPYNELGVKVVPIALLIDEEGVIRFRNPKPKDLKEFLASDYSEGPVAKREKLGRSQLTVEEMEEISPKSGVQHFQLGVAYRKRFDSEQRKPDDFSKAIASWQRALELDPNQYVWRRRIQQYGPRLDKPYSFYDWVRQARVDCLARGETPHSLTAEPRGSEFAHPAGKEGHVSELFENPDPEKKVFLDIGKLVAVQTIVVPSTKGDGKAVRIHLRFTPDHNKAVHWTNEAGFLKFYLEGDADISVFDLVDAGNPWGLATSKEERVVEFELRSKKGQSLPKKVKGNAYYYVCEGVDGTCLYLRKEIEIKIE